MSQENVEVVRRAINHLNETGEPEWSLYASDLVWTTRADGPAANTYRGLDGLGRGSASMRDVWTEVKAEILELVEAGDAIISVLRWSLRARSGVELEVEEAWVTWCRVGKIARIEQHGTKAEALKAVGLSE
jgi:ketosteroid isomerase-like protein